MFLRRSNAFSQPSDLEFDGLACRGRLINTLKYLSDHQCLFWLDHRVGVIEDGVQPGLLLSVADFWAVRNQMGRDYSGLGRGPKLHRLAVLHEIEDHRPGTYRRVRGRRAVAEHFRPGLGAREHDLALLGVEDVEGPGGLD